MFRDDTLIHHQEHIQTVITTSGTGQTVRWHGGVQTAVLTPSCQRTAVNTVWPVPDVVITVWMCSWWWMRVSSETCRAVCRKYNKTVYNRILLGNYWHYNSCLFFPNAHSNGYMTFPESQSDDSLLDFDIVKDYALALIFWINMLPPQGWLKCLCRHIYDSGMKMSHLAACKENEHSGTQKGDSL